MKNRNKKRTGKLLLVLNILMLFTLIAVPTYAFFWNNKTVDRSEDIVSGTVAEGLEVITEGELSSDKKLIPSSAVFSDSRSEVKELVYTITVGLDINEDIENNEKLNPDDLKVIVMNESDIKFDVADLGFLTLDISKDQEGNNVKVTIKFTIELTADQWEVEYNNFEHKVKVNLSLVEDTLEPTA